MQKIILLVFIGVHSVILYRRRSMSIVWWFSFYALLLNEIGLMLLYWNNGVNYVINLQINDLNIALPYVLFFGSGSILLLLFVKAKDYGNVYSLSSKLLKFIYVVFFIYVIIFFICLDTYKIKQLINNEISSSLYRIKFLSCNRIFLSLHYWVMFGLMPYLMIRGNKISIILSIFITFITLCKSGLCFIFLFILVRLFLNFKKNKYFLLLIILFFITFAFFFTKTCKLQAPSSMKIRDTVKFIINRVIIAPLVLQIFSNSHNLLNIDSFERGSIISKYKDESCSVNDGKNYCCCPIGNLFKPVAWCMMFFIVVCTTAFYNFLSKYSDVSCFSLVASFQIIVVYLTNVYGVLFSYGLLIGVTLCFINFLCLAYEKK